MSVPNRKDSSGGWRKDSLCANPERYVYEGRFETNGAGAPINAVGRGFNVAYSATGVYTITFDRSFRTLISASAWISGASNSNDDVVPDLASSSAGDRDTAATLVLVTQSVAGTAAALDGPLVCFEAVFSTQPLADLATLS